MADLEVVLGAKLDQFQRDMDQAGNIAERSISAIESRASQINPSLGAASSLFGGLTAGAGGLLALLASINSEVAQLGTGAQYLSTSTKDYQELLFAARSFGVSTRESVDDLANMGRLLNDAQRNQNSLTKLFDANGASLKNANGALISIDQLLFRGADFIKNAGSYADKVEIAKLLGLTAQWVPLLEQGGNAFEEIKRSAETAGGVIDAATIKKAQDFDAEWKKSSEAFAARFKVAVADVARYLDEIITGANEKIDQLAKNNPNLSASRRAELKKEQDDAVQRVSDFRDDTLTITIPQPVLDALRLILGGPQVDRLVDAANEARRNPIGSENAAVEYYGPDKPPGWKPGPRGPLTKIPGRPAPEDAFGRADSQAQKRTAEYEAEAEAVGKDTRAKVELKAAADLEAAAKRAGKKDTEELADRIQYLAQREGEAAQKAALANQAFAKQQELLNAVGDQAISVLDGIRTGSLNASQAVQQVTNFLITAIEKATLLGSGPLAGLFGTQSSPGSGAAGGLVGALGNLIGRGGGAAPGSITVGTQSFPAFAGGTDSAPGGLSLVGENGPELLNLPSGSQVVPNDVLRRNGGGVNVVINNAPSTPQVSSTPNGSGGMDVAINFVRGVISSDLVNGTGIAPTLKKFATASGFKGS